MICNLAFCQAQLMLSLFQGRYLAEQKKLCVCILDLEEAIDRVPRKVVEWAMRKKDIPESLVISVTSLYKGAKTKVKVGTHLSEELEVSVGVHQGSVLSPLLFDIVIDVVSSEIKEGMLQEELYADDLVYIAETMAELHTKFILGKMHLRA